QDAAACYSDNRRVFTTKAHVVNRSCFGQVTETDMYYLQDEDLARQLVELGYRGSGDTLQREEFEARKKALRERSTQKTNAPKQLSSSGKVGGERVRTP
ncbi:unnamed protein product, partial [Ectocarpus sp. 12 AP-2014]